jgi:hypothetical protein
MLPDYMQIFDTYYKQTAVQFGDAPLISTIIIVDNFNLFLWRVRI